MAKGFIKGVIQGGSLKQKFMGKMILINPDNVVYAIKQDASSKVKLVTGEEVEINTSTAQIEKLI